MPFVARIAIFVLLVAVVLFAMSFYVHRRASRALGLGRRARLALTLVFVSGPLAVVLGRELLLALPAQVAEPVSVYGFTVVLAVILSVALLLVVDLLRTLAWLTTRALHHFGTPAFEPASAPEPEPESASEPASASESASASAPESASASASASEPESASASESESESESESASASASASESASASASAPASASASPPAAPLSRRDLLTHTAMASAVFAGAGTSVYGALFGRHDYQIEEVPIAIPGLARALEGYAIVQLSDIHFGALIGEPELRAAVALVRAARPDVIVLTGDLLDHDDAYAPLLGQLVRRIAPLARDGVMVIPGNHDHYSGVEAVLDTARRGGAKVLLNSGRVLGDRGGAFAMLGVDDVLTRRNGYAGGPDLARALSTVPSDLPKILLCHNPSFFPEAAGEVALQLSGHTHGGQVNLFVRPADVVLPYGYVAGRYTRGESQLYVNRGFGTAGPPARIGAPPEVTKIVLTSA